MSRVSLKRNRIGRPRLTAGRKRELSIYLRLSERELFLLRQRAEQVGVSASCLARDLALYGTTPVPGVPRIRPAAIRQLGSIGHFLNQAMHRVNAGQLAPELRCILEDTHSLLTGLLHSLAADSE
jgi:hypothetical protein